MHPRGMTAAGLLQRRTASVLVVAVFAAGACSDAPHGHSARSVNVAKVRSEQALAGDRVNAIRAIRAGGASEIRDAKAALIAALDSAAPTVAYEASGALAVIASEASADLVSAVSNERLRHGALRALRQSEIPQPVADKLLSRLADAEYERRLETVNILGATAAKNPQSVSALRRAVSDRDPLVRVAAVRQLETLRALAASAVPELTAALRDGNRAVREEACLALAAIGPDAKAAQSELTRLARSADTTRKLAQAALTVVTSSSPSGIH